MPFISTHLQPYIYIYNQTSKFSGIVFRSGSYKHTFTFTSEPLSIHINLDLKQNFWYIDPWSRILTTVSVRPDLWSFILSSFFHSLIIQRALRFVVEVPLSSDVTAFTRCLKIPSCSLSFSFPHIFKVCSKKSRIVHKTKKPNTTPAPNLINYIQLYIWQNKELYPWLNTKTQRGPLFCDVTHCTGSIGLICLNVIIFHLSCLGNCLIGPMHHHHIIITTISGWKERNTFHDAKDIFSGVWKTARGFAKTWYFWFR